MTTDLKTRLRALLDPLGRGVPRRAVYTDVITDLTDAPDAPELDAVSEICHLVFGTETRHPGTLLTRALDLDIPSAWSALCDDLTTGHAFAVTDRVAAAVPHALLRRPPTEARTVACALLAASAPDALRAPLRARLVDIVGVQAALASPAAVASLQKLVTAAAPPPADVATILTRYPYAAKAVLLCDLRAAHACDPGGVVQSLETYARARAPLARTDALSALAALVQQGVAVRTDLGAETLVRVAGLKYDVRLAAACAVLMRGDGGGARCTVARLVESLAAMAQHHATRRP